MQAVDTANLFEKDTRVERRVLLGLSVPALLLVSAILLVPVGWLFWLSIVGTRGVTFENYTRLYNNASYASIFEQTFLLSAVVTFIVALLGYPVAYFIAQMPRKAAIPMLGLVLLPFWTSLLVRTFAWLVLLQRYGLVNEILMTLGASDRPLPLLYNFAGTAIGMVHIVLPFLILPLYAAMRGIDPSLTRAAMSLGSSAVHAFWRVFLPLSFPGLVAGTLLVFVYCLGFYIVPQLLGGGRVNTVSMKVLDNATQFGDWGAASALGVVLLLLTLVLCFLITRARPRRKMTAQP